MGLRYLGNIIRPGYNPLASNITTGVNTAQYQGVFTLQQQAQAQNTQAWTTDPLFENTTLLLQSDNAANGSQNNTFLDSSSNSFAITRNGNTTQGSFTPFSLQPGAWSNYFGGSGNYAVSNAAVFTSSTTTFTIEGWIYPTAAAVSASNIPSVIGDMQPVSTAAYWTFGILASGAVSFYWYDGASKSVTSNGTVSLNTWTHIAVSVNANAITLYINGVQQSLTGTTTLTNRTGSNSSVAFAQFSTTGSVFTGYVSNFSVLSGTAKYSTSFSPPLAPLPTGTTNQVLLFAYGNTFADSNTATTAKTFTITGTPSVQAFSPFAPQYQWTAPVIGGSGYFDGTGDYLVCSASGLSTALAFGTGDLSISLWFYPLSLSSTANMMLDLRAVNGGAGIYLYTNSSGNVIFLEGGTERTSSNTIKANQWNNIVYTRASGTLYLFLNGVSGYSGSSATSLNCTKITIGHHVEQSAGFAVYGYLSGIQILKGTGYSSVTVPTSPPTAITNTQFLTNFTNAGIFDGTMKNDLETVGNAQISTAVVKYGSGSMYFDGTGDWLLIPNSADHYFGTGQFTIELWVYRNASAAYGLVAKGTGTTGWLVSLNSSNQVVFTYASSTITSSGVVAASTWTHIAVVRETVGTNQTKIYINGVNDGQGTVTTDFNQTNSMYVGADRTGGSAFNGYIDDLRITKGIARYTQNFIPPSVALPRQ